MGLDIQVYQVYFQEGQRDQFFTDTIPIFNQDLGLYFESDIILNLYRSGKITGDYFGLLSWKARKKNYIRTKNLAGLIHNKYDMYSFTYDRHDVLGYANLCHPGFCKIFQELLSELGLDVEVKPRIGLYQNAIIAKPSIYIDYVENFLIPTISFFEKCTMETKRLLFADAKYRGVSESVLGDALGVKHYTYHTFILERLWSLFYHVRRRRNTLSYFCSNLYINSYRAVKVNSKGKLHRFCL